MFKTLMTKPYMLLKFVLLAKKYKAAYFTPIYDHFHKTYVPIFFKSKEEMEHYKAQAKTHTVRKPSFFFFDMSKAIGPQIIACFEKDLPKLAESRERLMQFLGAPKDWKKGYQKLVEEFRKIGHASELPSPA